MGFKNGINIKCLICSSFFYRKLSHSFNAKYCSRKCQGVAKGKLGKSYTGYHNWLRYNFGSANKCELCKITEPPKGKVKFFDWSLLKGKPHAKIRENYWMLCKRCHFFYDNPNGNLGQFKKGKPSWNKGKTFSEETCKKMSFAMQGRPAWNKGLKMKQLIKV